jgi:hypothetical protein
MTDQKGNNSAGKCSAGYPVLCDRPEHCALIGSSGRLRPPS